MAAALAVTGAGRAATLVASNLRCENQADPIAVQTTRPRLSWVLEPANPEQHGLKQTAYRILVASSPDLLAADRGDLWDTGKVFSSRTIEIPYQGQALEAGAECFWKVRVWDQAGAASAWSAVARWRVGLLEARDWRAKWIAAQPDGAAPNMRMPLFRYEFLLRRPVARAIAYISGLGQYEFSINGHKVGDAVLTPGWTNYRKTVFYNAYDVTGALRRGANALGVMLGNGMYNVMKTPHRYTKFAGSFGQPKLIAEIRITFTDGATTQIASGASWKVHPGPIVFSQPYGGEDYDAQLETPGWNEPHFDDRAWTAATEVSSPGGRLRSQRNPAIKITKVFHPVKISEPETGIEVYDLGQNFSGWPEVTVKGPAGAAVKLIPGELLDERGFVSQRSSGGPQWFSYTLNGAGRENWHPRFSYYGFRYVQVETTGGAQVLSLAGQFIHSSAPVVGEFSCSKDLFNRIHELIDAAIRSNMQSVLTDCPHREKLGWLEQSHLLGSSIMYNYDAERLYEKIAGDIRDSQTSAGLVPDIAPEYTVFQNGFRDSPEWGSAAVLNPWLVYRHYGNRRILAANFDVMKRYVGYLATRANDGIISYGLGDWYDIGPKRPGVSQLTALGVTATAIYYQDLVTLSKVARLLGKPDEADRFDRQAQSVRAAFNARFYHPQTRVYDRGSQTAYAMPLALGMVPEEKRAGVLNRLVEDIRRHHDHTTAGDIGFHYVMEALSRGGRSDVVYDLLANPAAPSYAAQLARGATTLTEAWDADPRSSQNHFMLGHAEEWFYRYLAGIDFDLSRAPGERIVLRPTPVGDITFARAVYRTPLGTIKSSWKLVNGRFSYDVEIPPNTTAKLLLPVPGAAARQLQSGHHHFVVAYAGLRRGPR